MDQDIIHIYYISLYIVVLNTTKYMQKILNKWLLHIVTHVIGKLYITTVT